MNEYNAFTGNFSVKHWPRVFHDINYYRFIFSIIFYGKDNHFVNTISENFFNQFDNFVYLGIFEKWLKNGSLIKMYLFGVSINNKIGIIDQDLNFLLPPYYLEFIVPVKSDGIFVVKNEENQWGAIDIFANNVIIEFGKYKKIWGFDHKHTLVSLDFEESYEDKTNRAIVNSKGKIVKGTQEYYTIYPFYNSHNDYIIVNVKKEDSCCGMVLNRNLNLLCKENPERWYWPKIEPAEYPRGNNYYSNGSITPMDWRDAYEDDPDARWNTD